MCHYKISIIPVSFNSQLNGKNAEVIAVLFLKGVKLFFQASFPHHRAVLKQQANQQLTRAGCVWRWLNTSEITAVTMIPVVCFAWTNRSYAANKSRSVGWDTKEIQREAAELGRWLFSSWGQKKKQNRTSNKTDYLSHSCSLKCKFDDPQSWIAKTPAYWKEQTWMGKLVTISATWFGEGRGQRQKTRRSI